MVISSEGFGIAIGKRLRAASSAVATCGVILLVPALAFAVAESRAGPCGTGQPDSLEINWTAPCQDGSWELDPRVGCRLWGWRPDPEDSATWSGNCLSGRKEGSGVVQWYEHGRPIDRFEGVFRHGEREGVGRYDWPAGQRYQGTYVAGLPNGQGTVTIDGASFTGIWHRGCLAQAEKRIAIGVGLDSCSAVGGVRP
jgi:MORN repeat protein